MKRIYFLVSLALLSWTTNAQAPAIDWETTTGGSGNDVAYGVMSLNTGGYALIGRSSSTDGDVIGIHGGQDVWISVVSDTGSFFDQETYGGTGNERAFDFSQANNNDIAFAGYTTSNDGDINGAGGFGQEDVWVHKMGALSWQQVFGGSGDDQARSIIEGYVVAGYTTSSDGDVVTNQGGYDFWVLKLNLVTGSIISKKTLGGSGDDYAYSVRQTSDGGFIVAGHTTSGDGDVSSNSGGFDQLVFKLDVNLNIVWTSHPGGSDDDYCYEIQQTADGGYILAGGTKSADYPMINGNNGGFDVCVAKMDSSGSLLWAKTYGGSGDDRASSIRQTSDGGYIVAGTSNSPNDGDVTGNHGDYDSWILRLDVSGNLLWQKSLGGTGVDNAQGIEITNDGGYIIGNYSNSNDGDVTGNQGGYDFWAVKLAPDLGIDDVKPQNIAIYPNPAKDKLHIDLGRTYQGSIRIVITDVLGQRLFKTQMENGQKTSIPISSKLGKGVYFVSIFNEPGNRVLTRKIILQ